MKLSNAQNQRTLLWAYLLMITAPRSHNCPLFAHSRPDARLFRARSGRYSSRFRFVFGENYAVIVVFRKSELISKVILSIIVIQIYIE